MKFHRLVTNFNLIQLLMMWRSFAVLAANMRGQRESSFIIMGMECQSLLLMEKFGFSTRFPCLSYHDIFCIIYSAGNFSKYLFLQNTELYTNICFYWIQSYTQYIPLQISDLDSWLKTPSIYVFDCSAAGMIINAFMEVCCTVHWLCLLLLMCIFFSPKFAVLFSLCFLLIYIRLHVVSILFLSV